MIIQVSKELYQSLSESEKVVINYINEHENSIPSMSITTLADKTFTSPATVSRAIQRCGFKGISELRYNISNTKEVYDTSYLTNDILAKTYRECVETIDNIRVTSVFKIVENIILADKIFIYARGITALVAEDFQTSLQFLGYNAHVVKDVIWIMKTDRLVSKNDLIVYLTVKNTTSELALSAKMAKDLGASVVVCCCTPDTNLEAYADVSIIGYAEDVVGEKDFAVYSRLPLMIICRTIVEYLK